MPADAPGRVAVASAVSCAAPQTDSPDAAQHTADALGRVPAGNRKSSATPQADSATEAQLPADAPERLFVLTASRQVAPQAESPREAHYGVHAPGRALAGNAESCTAPQADSPDHVSAGNPGQVTAAHRARQPDGTPGQAPAVLTAVLRLGVPVSSSNSSGGSDPGLRKINSLNLEPPQPQSPQGYSEEFSYSTSVTVELVDDDDADLADTAGSHHSPDADVASTAACIHQSDAAPETSEFSAALSDDSARLSYGTARLSDGTAGRSVTLSDVSGIHGSLQQDAANEALHARVLSNGLANLPDTFNDVSAMRGPPNPKPQPDVIDASIHPSSRSAAAADTSVKAQLHTPQPEVVDARIHASSGSAAASDTSEQARLRNPHPASLGHSERSEDPPAEETTTLVQLTSRPQTASGQLPPAGPLVGLRIILDEGLSLAEATRCASYITS